MKILVVDDSSSGADLVATLRQKRDVEVATANPPYAISANEDGSISDPWALALLRECSQEKFEVDDGTKTTPHQPPFSSAPSIARIHIGRVLNIGFPPSRIEIRA